MTSLPSQKDEQNPLPEMKIDQYHITLIGSGGVGKTSTLYQYVLGEQILSYDPTGPPDFRKLITLPPSSPNTNNEREMVMLELLDFEGEWCDTFSAMRDLYVKESDAVIIVYSVTNRHSFDEIEKFREEVLRVKPAVVLALAGNKIDVVGERKVDGEEGKKKAGDWGVRYFEISAKKGVGVDAMFEETAGEIKRYKEGKVAEEREWRIGEEEKEKKKKKKRSKFSISGLKELLGNHFSSNNDVESRHDSQIHDKAVRQVQHSFGRVSYKPPQL